MDLDILITGIVGFVTTIVSSWTSWFFARKKYNSEVDSNLINNMKESLEFYDKLSENNKSRLEELIQRNIELEDKVDILEKKINKLSNLICKKTNCKSRQL